jgi:hypothetical protein
MTRLTTDFLCEILLKGVRISPEQVREIRAKQGAKRLRIVVKYDEGCPRAVVQDIWVGRASLRLWK